MKKLISISLVLLLSIINMSGIYALEKEDSFTEWTKQIFENNINYDVINSKNESVKVNFIQENMDYYLDLNFEAISKNFMYNKYSYCRTNVSPTTRDSSAKNVSKEFLDQYTQRGKTITIETELSSTLRVDNNTGVIRSYSGPYLSLTYENAGYAFSTNLIEANTDATYSSTRRTITFSCSYRAQSIGSESGVRFEYTSPVFSHSFTAG